MIKITVRVNRRGMITIPAPIRKQLNIKPEDMVSIHVTRGESIMVKKEEEHAKNN